MQGSDIVTGSGQLQSCAIAAAEGEDEALGGSCCSKSKPGPVLLVVVVMEEEVVVFGKGAVEAARAAAADNKLIRSRNWSSSFMFEEVPMLAGLRDNIASEQK